MDPAHNDNTGLEEVVVTAQRKEENLQSIPIAVTALSAETLAQHQIRDLSRVEVLTPGFSFGKSGSDARPAIRGVRTENVAVSGDPTIGFFVDNVYRSRASQANEPFVDVAMVEIQRGPQGTLYGRNTFGGNIAITSAAPVNRFEGGLDLTAGEFDRRAASGFLNLPANDSVQFRFAALREKMDGYVKGIDHAHDIFSRDTQYYRAAMRIAANDVFEAVFRYSYWKDGGTGGAAFGYRVGGALVNAAGALDIKGNPILINIGPTENRRPIDPRPLFYPGDTFLVQDVDEKAASLNMSYNFGPVVLRSITGHVDFRAFRNADNDFTEIARNVDAQDDKLSSFSQEVQLASNREEAFEWLLGYYYFKENIDYSVFSSCPSAARNTPGCAFAAGFPNTQSNAFFGQASWWVLPKRVRFTAGVRETRDEKDVTRYNATTDVEQRIASVTSTGQRLDFKFRKTTWRINGEYHFDNANMLYASMSTGFRSGGFNAGAFTNPALPGAFQPENVLAYEIGSKSRFANGRMQLNIAAYRNNFSDLQVQNQFIVVGATGTTTTSVILNAAKAHSQGLEVEFEALPIDNLHVGLSATLMEAKFDRYQSAPAPARYSGFYDLSGYEIPYSPNAKLTGTIAYDVTLANGSKLTPQVTGLYSSSYQLTDFNTVLDRQKAYGKMDLRLAWTSPSDHYSVEGFVNNVTDEVTLNRATFGSRGLNESFDAPRMWGARFGARF